MTDDPNAFLVTDDGDQTIIVAPSMEIALEKWREMHDEDPEQVVWLTREVIL